MRSATYLIGPHAVSSAPLLAISSDNDTPIRSLSPALGGLFHHLEDNGIEEVIKEEADVRSVLAPAMRLRVSEIAVWVRSMIRSISSLVRCMLAVVVPTGVSGLWNGSNILPPALCGGSESSALSVGTAT